MNPSDPDPQHRLSALSLTLGATWRRFVEYLNLLLSGDIYIMTTPKNTPSSAKIKMGKIQLILGFGSIITTILILYWQKKNPKLKKNIMALDQNKYPSSVLILWFKNREIWGEGRLFAYVDVIHGGTGYAITHLDLA
ncbi:hypothetical protein ACJX0J_030152, partial [Zea mays]